MSDTDVTVYNLRDRSVSRTSSTSQHKSHRSSTKSKSSTGSESSAGEQITDQQVADDSVFVEPHDALNTEQAELELVNTFQQLGCHDSPPPTAPPAYTHSTPIEVPSEKPTPQTQPVSDLATNAPVFKLAFAPSLYPITELSEMAECREVTFAKDAPPKSSVDDEACKKHMFSRPPETKHTFGMRSYDIDDHEPTARVAISEIPAPRPIVSDSVIAPKPFSGTATEDGEAWAEYFERYAKYKNMNDDEQTALFAMFMRDGAAQWLSTLPAQTTRSYFALKQAFRDNYFKSRELLWKEAGDLFNQSQRPDERVDDFVIRLKRSAKRLNITDDTLHFAVIHGLRSPIRMHVLQQGVQDLEQTLRAARIAEASTATDSLTALLLETIKTTAEAAHKQAADIKDLSTKVSALSASGITAPVIYTDNGQPATNAVGPNQTHPVHRTTENYQHNGNFRPRVVKQTPRNIQRASYAQQTANRRSVGQTSFKQPQTVNDNCRNCGLQHRQRECKAFGQQCHNCNKLGHFARVCRSNKPAASI
jgi:hypothetical protein